MSTPEKTYTVKEEIAKGSFGVVYRVVDCDGKQYALKSMPSHYDGLDCLMEIHIQSWIRHMHLMWIEVLLSKHNCQSIEGISWTLPLANHTLYTVLKDDKYGMQQRLKTFYCIGAALECLHRHHFLHLDIKTDNIVLMGSLDNCHPMLIDFGLGMHVDDLVEGKKYEDIMVTVDYRAPEILEGSRVYNQAVDIWSMGILLLTLVCGYDIVYIPLTYSANCVKRHIEYLNRALQNTSNEARRADLKDEIDLTQRCDVLENSSTRDNTDVKATIDDLTTKINDYREKDILHFLRTSFAEDCIDNTILIMLQSLEPSLRAQILDVSKHMLALNPADRWSITKILDHELFAPFANPDIRRDYLTHNVLEWSKQIDPAVLDGNFRKALKLIWAWFLAAYPDVTIEAFYLAIDLFYRSTTALENKSSSCLLLNAATCLWMSLKLTHQPFKYLTPDILLQVVSTDTKSITYDLLLDNEIKLIHHFGGVLYRPFIYDAMVHSEHAYAAFCDGILPEDKFNTYQTIEPKEFIKSLSVPDDIELLPKNQTMATLFGSG